MEGTLSKLKELPPALVLCLSGTGIAVGRILSKHGVDVYGAAAAQDLFGGFSKYIKKPFFGYKVSLNERLLDNLIEFSRKLQVKPVLFPCSDDFIEFISRYFDCLNEHYLMQESFAPNIMPKFLDKKDFYRICEEHDIPYPTTILLTGKESISDITAQLRFPIILKPYLIHKWKLYLKGKKVILINNSKELEEVFTTHKLLLKDSMLQEVIPGPEENIFIFKCYYSKEGKLLSSFTGRKIRQYPPNFGSGSLAESLPNEDVERLSMNFLRKLKFHGLCGTEFKYDSRDDEYKIIEINIRPQLWEDLTRVAEREVVWVTYCDLAGIDIPPQGEQKNDVKWSYLTRDIVSSLWHIRRGNVGVSEWIKSYAKVRTDALIDFQDIRLLLNIPTYTFYQFYKYFVRRK